MYKFNYSAERFNENQLNKRDILKLILKHETYVSKMKINDDYYMGKHSISKRQRADNAPNHKIMCNHARYITDIATGYFMGNPIAYTSDDDISVLTDVFDKANVDMADTENAKNMSKYGLAYEYVFAKENEAEPTIKTLSPKNTFMVYDDTIEEKELFAVYYYKQKDDATEKERYRACVLTENYRYDLSIDNRDVEQTFNEEPQQHFFKGVPVVEYLNNDEGIGDFEHQISLIDAYNTLMSDRINDKEQFLDSLLVLYGVSLADDEEGSSLAVKSLKRNKLLEMPVGSKAEYLVHSLDENGVEVLRKAVEADIHKFSYVPCLTDESFAGNASGVAMEYKLLGLEMITKTKTRCYRNGLRKRIRLLCNFLSQKAVNIDPESVVANFTRGLPKNMTEIAQMVATLDGKVSNKTLISQLPFVEDVDNEEQQLQEEKKNNIENQQSIFGNNFNQSLEGGADEQ